MDLENLNIRLDKIVNLQISQTVFRTNDSIIYEVVPFEQNVLLDKGVYDRKEGNYHDLMGLKRIKIRDKWEDKVYEYGKTSNERSQDVYEITPKYGENRVKNRNNAFAFYSSSNALETGRGYTHTFLSSIKVIHKLLRDDFFTEEFGNILVEQNIHAKSIATIYKPTEELVNSIDNLDRKDILAYLCMFSTFFILTDFTENSQEETNEYRVMKRFLTKLNNRQSILEDDFVKNGFLKYLGMLSRSFEYNKTGNGWEFITSTSRRFSKEVKTNMKKFGNSHISGISDKFNKYNFRLSEEIYQLLGYDRALLNSYKEEHMNPDYISLKESFISPYIETSKSYKECATDTLDFINSKGENIENKLTNLIDTISNGFSSMGKEMGLLEYEASEYIKQQVTSYSTSLLRYIRTLKEDIYIGRFKIRDESMVSISGYVDEPEFNTTVDMLKLGYMPFGYTMLPLQIEFGSDIEKFKYLNDILSYGVSTPDKHFSKGLTNSIFMEELREFPGLNEMRRDNHSNKLKISEIEILNNSIKELLLVLNSITNIGVNTGVREVVFGDIEVTDKLEKNLKLYKDYEKSQHELLNSGVENFHNYAAKTVKDITVIKDRINSNPIFIEEKVSIKDRGVTIELFLDLEKIDKYKYLVDSNYNDGTALRNNLRMQLEINKLYSTEVSVLIEESINNIVSYIIEIYENRLNYTPELSKVYGGISSIMTELKQNQDAEVKIFDTEDLMTSMNNDMINVVMNRLNVCMCKIEACKVEGKLRREYVDIGTSPSIVEYVKPTKISMKINVPYTEYHNIINNQSLDSRLKSVGNYLSTASKGNIRGW